MSTLQLLLLIITVNVMASEDTANNTAPVLPELKNFKFEDQPDQPQYGLIRFDEHRFQQHSGQTVHNEGQKIAFEDNRINNQRPNQQKKKRRRRPKQRFPGQNGGAGYPMSVYPGSVYPGAPMYPGPVFGPGPIYPGQRPYPVYPGPQYKPRPSVTSAALSAVTEALGSIATYDDAQCVPRLLCEAAGGTGSIPGAGLLQSISGLQPLLTLLTAYNGISSSPLFVFGRAVFLGMTSKANPGTCRYAYPQCPNDPEQLVHYLNNHNGGFFRFFAAPELNQQQGLEQFYNQLSGQNYGLYQPQQNPLQQQNSQQGYGLHYQNQNLFNGQYQNQILPQPQQSYQDHLHQFNQGLPQQQYLNQYNQRPPNGYGLYGQRYPYQNNLNQNYFKSNEMQKRILNAQNTVLINNVNPKWTFPKDSNRGNKDVNNNVRLGKVLKFPQSNIDSNTAAEGFLFDGIQSNRQTDTVRLGNALKYPHSNMGSNTAADGFLFPGIQSNRQYAIDSFESIDSISNLQDVNDFRIVNQQFYQVDNMNEDTSNNDGVRTLYVVRGNGDPRHPEIVHLAPGETL